MNERHLTQSSQSLVFLWPYNSIRRRYLTNTASVAILILIVASITLLGIGCSSKSSNVPDIEPIPQHWLSESEMPEANKTDPWNLLLITLDTVRADHFGCYGHRESPSPNIDKLAKSGILFENAITPVPITLPAHCTIMTGLDPLEHGVRGNGSFALQTDGVTLAEVLLDKGYQTGATVGAIPVESGFGLEQGFIYYDDDFKMKSRGLDGGVVERLAEDVTTGALNWILDQGDSPFFHWAHYYDPHLPYEPPTRWRSTTPTLYDDEIHYMDHEIQRLIDGLGESGLLENTWIVLVGDHGEALGEHGESSHGMLIYSPTQHVPLILIPPANWQAPKGAKIRNRRIKETVGLRDLAPTLVNALGYPQADLPASGSSLLPLITGDWNGPGVVYMESLMPSLDYGWSELRGVRTSKWSYIRAPEEELYDIASDPTEKYNLYYRHPEVAKLLADWLNYFLGNGDESLSLQAPDPKTIERLRSLGYMGGAGSHEATDSNKDPKMLMHLVTAVNRALTMIEAAPLQSKALLEQVLVEDPENRVAKRFLGKAMNRLEMWPEAEELLRPLLEIWPDDSEIQSDLAKSLIMMDSLTLAEPLVLAATEDNLDNPAMAGLYAEYLSKSGRLNEARDLLKRCSNEFPTAAEPTIYLARLEMSQNNIDEAAALARQAIERDNNSAEGFAILGEMLWLQLMAEGGSQETFLEKRAIVTSYLEKAVSLDKSQPIASFRLGLMSQREGNKQRAIELYKNALTRSPKIVEAHINLASLFLEQRQGRAALVHFRAASALGQDSVNFLVSYGVACAMAGENAEARAAWERALAQNPDAQVAAGIRQNLIQLGQ